LAAKRQVEPIAHRENIVATNLFEPPIINSLTPSNDMNVTFIDLNRLKGVFELNSPIVVAVRRYALLRLMATVVFIVYDKYMVTSWFDSTKVLSARSSMLIISGYDGCYSAHPGLRYMIEIEACKLS
jgi:hypothetical protein